MSLAEDYVTKVNALDPSEHPENFLDEFDDFETVEYREVLDQHRWYNIVQNVYKCTDGSHFAVQWDDPATEMQESDDKNARAFLVEPQIVMVTKYVKVKK